MKENILSDIYDTLEEVIMVINDDFSIESINRKGKEVFQIEENQLSKNKCYELICQKKNPIRHCPLYCLKNNKVPDKDYTIEYGGHVYKGTCKQFNRNEENQEQYLDVFHDITHIAKKEKEQKEIRDEYETLNEEYLSSIEELKEKNELILEEKQKYEKLFTHMNSAFALHEIILNEKGHPCNYKFIECNPMFEKLTGLKASKVINKTVLDVMPETEKYWIETYGKVALERKPIQFMNFSKFLGKYYETYSYSPRKGYFAVTFNDVTCRVEAEKAIESKNKELEETLKTVTEKEQMLQTIFNSSPSVMLLLDENTEIIQMNQAGLEATEKNAEEVVGLRGGDVYRCINTINTPQGCGYGVGCKNCGVRNAVEYCLKTGNQTLNKETEIHVKNKNNKLIKRNILVSARLIKNRNKKNILVTIDDITQKKKEEKHLIEASEKVLESEAKFKAAFMTSPDAVNINAMDGTYIEINKGFTSLTGFTREDVIGIKSSEINIWAIPEDRVRLIETLKNVGEISNLESLFRCKDGSLKTALMSANIIKLNNEPHILSITRDITDKKLSDKKLKVESTIAEAFAKTDSNIVFHNVLETIIEFFQCEYGLFGYIDENSNLVCPSMTYDIWDKCQMPDKTIVFPKEKWGGMWGKSLFEKNNIIKNENLNVPEGHIKLKNALSVVIKDKSELTGLIVLGNKANNFADIDRMHLEEFCQYIAPLLKAFLKEINYKQEIINAKEKAEKADRLKTAFLANMSHEIRTPLNGIMGFTELLTSEQDLSRKQRSRYASIISKSSESLLQIVNDILDISSLESGNFSLFKKPFELNNCLFELYNLFSHKISESNKDIQLIEKKAVGKIVLNNDENRFRQIFSNLLDNAIKFTEKGSIQFGLSEVKNEELVLFVSDSGIGIPEDKHNLIFDRFRQGEESSTRVYGGNGLGLSIVKELVHLMGGNIWLNSVIGEGSTFYFTLPLAKSADEEKKEEKKVEGELRINNQKINILIVEDDEFNAQYLEELLLGINAEYTICKEGQPAIDKVKSNQFDIILMDIQLPDINGLDAVKEIRKFNRKIPIIAQTADAMQSDEEKAIAAGCNGYISKPIKRGILLDKIKTATHK